MEEDGFLQGGRPSLDIPWPLLVSPETQLRVRVLPPTLCGLGEVTPPLQAFVLSPVNRSDACHAWFTML